MNNEIHWSCSSNNDREHKKSAVWRQTICWVSGRLNFHWVDLNKPLGRVYGLLQTGVAMVYRVDSYESFQLFKFELCTTY